MSLIYFILLAITVVASAGIVIYILRRNESGEDIANKISILEHDMQRMETLIREEMGRSRAELTNLLGQNREEISRSLSANEKRFGEFIIANAERSDAFTSSVNSRFEHIRESMTENLSKIQDSNAKKLDEMRKIVDEKLQESVEKRFNDSFKLISERLEAVHKGLGEMQNLASGVGDLKRVLTNVKTRGCIGEVQLGAILEQYLSPDQYLVTAQVRRNTHERVEFAVKMPGKKDEEGFVLLPIDSKFPTEDYQRLLTAYENASSEDIAASGKALETAIKRFAGDIRNKYINPPVTTDFALMFVPSEGLYAEVLRRPGLFEQLQRDYRVTVVGPANLVAFLNSLQMGFRTLAIEKRSSEVWSVLGAVKTEFGKFSDVLEKMRNRLDLAVKEIDNAGRRSRAIERKLKNVEQLPGEEATALLALDEEFENFSADAD
ncbi:MAG: DNA recombination protein RmuC [Lentisphaeria bacterium]|nr:DNA recombination protein RmuC [Lentisphaeria bacterium]